MGVQINLHSTEWVFSSYGRIWGKMTSECTVLRLYNEESHSQRSRAEDICMRKFSVVTSVCFNWLAACVAVYTKSCLTVFVTPWTVAHQAPLSMRLPRQEYWSTLLFPPPRNIPDPGIKAMSPALTGRFFDHCATRKAPISTEH